jgi:hypothetical protein
VFRKIPFQNGFRKDRYRAEIINPTRKEDALQINDMMNDFLNDNFNT